MIEWLKSLPKTTFVTLVLTAGILFIVLSDPPRSLCDVQVEAFREETKDFLRLDPIKKPNRKESRYTKLVDTCKLTNSAGGCYELFLSLKKLLKDMQEVSPECLPKLSSYTEFQKAIWGSIDLMVKLAWGEKPPALPTLKSGWFDPSDLNLFCELKRSATNIEGEQKWGTTQESYFQLLPGAQAMERSEAWQRMLFSINCGSYL